ncbi:MAG: SLBB domain-containing protein [Oscillospiraceae bacterium]
MKLFDTVKGVYLDQEKEPALSRDIIKFISHSEKNETISCTKPKYDKYTISDLISIAKDAEIVDDHDGKMLYKKLRAAKNRKLRYIIGDAVDDEPYISSQMNPLLKLQEEVCGGLKYIKAAFDNVETYFTVYKHIFDMEIQVPKEIGGIEVRKVGGKYPVEGINANIKSKDTLIIGVGALIFLYRAITLKEKQTTTFITVSGNCIGNPCNLEVSVGMPIMTVIERCGLAQNPNRIVIGGAMVGINIIDPEKTLITKHTGSVLCFKDNEKDRNFDCIKCGRCERQCPAELNPMLIYKSIQLEKNENAIALGAFDCIGCGVCSYICPSKLDVSHEIQSFKQKTMPQGGTDDDEA